jgi:hypothetical protein
MMDLSMISRVLITIAILSQLFHLRKNKQIVPSAFLLYSFASYMMAYEYYKMDREMSSRFLFKMFNSTALLLIGIMAQ